MDKRIDLLTALIFASLHQGKEGIKISYLNWISESHPIRLRGSLTSSTIVLDLTGSLAHLIWTCSPTCKKMQKKAFSSSS
jgi:hypothetical protein